MEIGDLVIADDSVADERTCGTILRFDWYNSPYGFGHPQGEELVEILWNTGQPGWILKSRVKPIDESRRPS